MALLSVANLCVDFVARTGTVHAVRKLGFSLQAGQCLAIVGESGSGKSATARALVGLAGPTAQVSAERLELDGQDLRGLGEAGWRHIRGRKIGFILQDALVSLDPLRTIGAEVGETIITHRLLPRHKVRERVVEVLDQVGFTDARARLDHHAHQLSGGLRQRALIASALSGDPAVLIADEPTTALDVIVQAQVLSVLKQLKQAGRAIILISHDLAVVAELADQIIVMKDGVAIESGTPQEIFRNPAEAYTRQLLAAIPRATPPVADGAVKSAPEKLAGDVVLTVSEVSRRFGTRNALDKVSLSVHKGEILGIVGASGSGKTTLARVIMALERPDSGLVTIDGAPWSRLSETRRRPLRHAIQLVSQDPMSAFDPRYTVRRLLGEALEAKGVEKSLWPQRIGALLASVGLSQLDPDRRPAQLSGGQRQRVAIARALAMEPRLLVCDEPVSALDVSTQAVVLDLLVALRDRLGLTMLFISHDLGVIRQISDRVVVMNDGRIVEVGPIDTVLSHPEHPYTRALLEAQPKIPATLAAE